MDRRESLKWMMAVLATVPSWNVAAGGNASKGYGTDPDLVKRYRMGDLWPLTFDATQKAAAAALCSVIIPAYALSKSAAQLDVHVFIDEWVSAPYPRHVEDRKLIVEGLAWLDEESGQRFKKPFAKLALAEQHKICDDICWPAKAKAELAKAARFFARFRDLTADGYYSTPEGMKELGFTGNKASVNFDGPPVSALKKAGLI
ncbi:MAG: gluconate 2-dehydrogenase subunit 3 family protein [Betaproteobacteria bacterium]|nr:gluconate 2-dehydrogenase subunit 3 family protein [Betaproteobacteria bacterium]